MKKKTLKRIMALLLAVCLITASWPVDTYASNTEDQVQADQESDTEAGEDPVTLPLSEETSLKQENTETSTTFLVGEEEKKTVFYQEPVRYEDEETGDLIDYDPSLIPLTEEDRDVLDESGLAEMTEDVPYDAFEEAGEADPDAEEMTEEAADGPVSSYAYTNAQGDARQYFPEVLQGDTPVILTKEDYSLTMAPVGDFAPVEVEEETYTDGYEKTEALPLKAVYESPSDHCSYAFTSMKDGVKEELVLERLPSSNVFTYEITLGGLGIRKAEGEEGFLLYDLKDREAVAAIAAPFMNDATGKAYSEDIRTEIKKVPGETGTYRMTLILDAGYLRDARRRYPVTVDPTVTWKGNTDMGDVCVCGGSGYKDKNFYDSTTTGVNMKAGKGDKGVYRTYIDFRNLKTTVRNKYVESAIFSMYETGYSNSGQVVQAYRVKSSWTRSQITWNNKPAYETLYDTVSSTGKNKKLRKLDLTAFVRGLAKNAIENYGIMLKGSTETGHYCEFHGSRYSTNTSLRSKFVVTYYDKPTAPTSVTITPNYLKKGCKSTVKWTGISSKGLAYVQYRVARYNTATGQDQDTVIAYGPDRMLGTTASGSYLLPNTAAWKEGVWHLYVRGVDKGDIPGSERGAILYIDATPPAQGTVTISPSTSQGNPSASPQPLVSWSGFTDTYLKDIAYQINGGPYTVVGHAASGSFTPDEEDFPVSGSYVITIRATDRAGHATTASATYCFQATPDLTDYAPNDGISTSCRYGKNTLDWEADEEANEYIYYRVYSGDNANFVKSDKNLAGDHITTSYWTDIRLHDSAVTYKMEVVCTDTEGTIQQTLDAGTVTLSVSCPDPDTFPGLGSGHPYRSYREMPFPMGTGQADRVSGNWNYSQQDTTLPSSQIGFTVERAYDSQSQTSGMFGPGWNDSLHKELAQGEDGTIYFTDSDGTVYPFTVDGNSYQCPENPDLTLQTPETAGGGILENLRGAVSGLLGLGDGEDEDEEDLLSSEDFETGQYDVEGDGDDPDTYDFTHAYTVKTKGGELYRFNEGGQLVSVMEPNGTFLLFLYDEEGRVSEITTEAGKKVSVTYNAAGLAEEILLPDETTLQYVYTDGKLTSASHYSANEQDHVSFGYAYNGTGKMTGLTDGKNQGYTLAYTGEKLSSLTDPLGESLHFAYQTGQTAAVKKDAGENTVFTELTVYDSLGRTTAETDTDGNTISYTYGSGAKQYLVTGTSRAGEWETYDDATGTISRQEVSLETGSVYNNDLNLIRQEEEDGTVTVYSYSGEGKTEWNEDLPAAEEESVGNTVTDHRSNTYDQLGNLVKEVSSPPSVAEEYKVITTNTYEDGNLETTSTEGDGQFSYSQYSYDADGNQIGENGKSGSVKTKESALYDEMGNVVSSETVNEENEPLQSEDYGYDYLGREISCTISAPGQDDRVTTKAYDANGSLIRETDGDGVVTEYTYDAANRVISREVTKGQDSVVRLFSYGYEEISIHTLSGSVTVPRAAYRTESDGNNTLISKTWSTASGRTLSEISGGVRTDYSYDASGNCIAECTYPATESNPDLFWTVSLYDQKGQQTGTAANASVSGNGTASVTADTAFIRTSYDDKGNVIQETDAMGTVTAYTYDDTDRITKVSRDAGSNDPSETEAAYRVDEAVTETTVTDPLRDQKVEKTDASGLVLETKDLDGDTGQHITTRNTYDPDGNLVRILHEDGSRQDMAYNAAGLLTGKTSYDASGLETMQTLYDYDGKGRQTSMKDYRMEGGQERLFRVTATGYDAYGRTAWVSETDSTDGQGPSQSMIDLHKISYSYDAEDRLVRKDYPLAGSGIRGLCYIYDGTGRLTEIKAVLVDSTQKTVRTLEYDSLGRLSVTEDYPGLTGTSGTCIRRAYQYDVFDRITGIEYKKGNTLLEEYHYTYDKNGNITGKTEKNLTPSARADRTDRSIVYTYDAYGRLTGSRVTDHNNGNAVASVTYSYDKAGNRTGKTEGNKTTAYTYNGLDQLTEAVTVSGMTELSHVTYAYDDNGNQTEEADSISGRTVVNRYDEENRLSGTVITEPQPGADPSILTQTNSYNGDGQRVKKDEDGNVTRYFYEDDGVSYTTGTGSTQKDLQYIRDLSGSVFLAQESGGISGPVTWHYDDDIQGSTTSLLDTSGEGLVSYNYDDFGNTEIHGDLTCKNEVFYTGGVYDQLTEDYYLNARYYSPEAGRFLTEDTYRGTIGSPESLHLYAYCANDPINSIDPSGNNPILLYYAYVALASGTCVLVGTVWWNHHRTVIKGKKYLPSRIKLQSKSKVSIQNRIAVHIFTGLVYKHIVLSKSKKKNDKRKNDRPTSKKVWQRGPTERIEVENYNNGKGNIHYHDPNNGKWKYDLVSKCFTKDGVKAPKRIQKLLKEKEIMRAIDKAIKYLDK